MTAPDLATALRERMQANRQPVERSPWHGHEHPRGWNDALDWIERQIKELTGEKIA